jgi:glycosyltransferase involved in cell wall biosynthesis
LSHKSVCHITFSEFPNDPRVRRYVSELLTKGYKVIVICIVDEYNKLSEEKENLKIIRLNVTKKRAGYIKRVYEYLMFFVKSFYYSTKVYFTDKVRIYQLHTFPDFIVFSALIPKLLGARIILDMHELTPETMMERESFNYDHLLIKSLMLIEQLSVRFASEVITIHDVAASLLHSRNKKKFTVIMNGVDNKELRLTTKYSDGYFNIIYHGTINSNLNLTLVLDALEIIKTRTVDEAGKIRFLLYGKGPDTERILSKAEVLNLKSSVIYHGVMSYENMLRELGKASALVFPPLKNVFTDICYSVKITEVINLQIPIIASRLKTLSCYYPEECFFYFDPGNAQMLAEKILEVMNNPQIVKQKTEAALRKYKSYSWDVMKQRYMKLINELGVYEKV